MAATPSADAHHEGHEGAAMSTSSTFVCKQSRCATCQEPRAAQRCARCGLAAYCGKQCQVDDWKYHKKVCVVKSIGDFPASPTSSRLGAGTTQAIQDSFHATSKISNRVEHDDLPGAIAQLQAYLQAGGDVNFRCPITGWTMLHAAVTCDDHATPFVAVLIRHGADPSVHTGPISALASSTGQVENLRSTPLHLACMYSNPLAIELLVNAGANMDLVNGFQRPPLLISSFCLATLQALHSKGCNMHATWLNPTGATPLRRTNDDITPQAVAAEKACVSAGSGTLENVADTMIHRFFNGAKNRYRAKGKVELRAVTPAMLSSMLAWLRSIGVCPSRHLEGMVPRP